MSDRPLDKQALLDLVDEDPAFLESLVGTFREESARYLEAIRHAIEEGDGTTVRKEAHGLKGAVANLHAEPTREAARRLEEIGRSGNLDRATAALDDLEHEVVRLRSALSDMVEEFAE